MGGVLMYSEWSGLAARRSISDGSDGAREERAQAAGGA